MATRLISPQSAGVFRFSGGDARTTILGATGSGKSTCGVWMLSHQKLDVRPWIIIDFKRETLFDQTGFPPIQPFGLTDKLPRKPGLYLVSPFPGQEELVDALLWKIWQHENIGIFVDEAALMPDGDGFPAVLQQGRSKRIPVIACSQRPVSVPRGLFSEANFFAVYRMVDRRDYKTVEGFVPGDLSRPLPPRHWFWYDREYHTLLHMAPVPSPKTVAAMLQNAAPVHADAWHPFKWTSRTTGRAQA